ncbi:MAG: TIGR03619 family F420-dependent LLM class oxidoreductase [Chloroflexota bacterium]|nr:TIGR03619 family F420-dependent LLM class oxidoreductase [Chloroflexota bacterium]
MKIGVFLPSFLFPGTGPEHAHRVRAFACRAEELGFASLWITDHIITARQFYAVSWLDSLMALSHVAALTERIRLGTSILILPVRQPAVLAKEVTTLQHLSGGRYIFGIGTGWYGPEFEACGVHKSERGARTDEVLAATTALLRQTDVHFSGRYYRLDGVTVEPIPPSAPPVWAAGGRQLVHPSSPEKSEMNPAVLRRIVGSDGWIARPTCPPELIAIDLADIRRGREVAGRAAEPFTVAHENFVHLVEHGSADEVVRQQQAAYRRLTGETRPWDYISAVYLNGTIDAIQESVAQRQKVGIEHLMLHTLTTDLGQLELIAKHILQPFGS